MKMTRRLWAVLAAVLLLAAACGDDSSDDGDGGVEAGEDAAPADGGCATTVCMEGIQFTELEVSIAPGETVTWTNLDGAPHTVTSDDGTGLLDSGNIDPEGTFEHTFADPGEYTYFCEIHPQMEASISVI